VRTGLEAVAGQVPAELGIPVISLLAEASADGWRFGMERPVRPSSRPVKQASNQDAAIIANTTGTTGRPRLMAWTHRHLAIAADRFDGDLATRPDDVFLGLVPLYLSGAIYLSLC